MSLTKHNKERNSCWYFDICNYLFHLIFCDSHRVGYCQKAFFDTVVEYSACKYLANYLNYFIWQTQ